MSSLKSRLTLIAVIVAAWLVLPMFGFHFSLLPTLAISVGLTLVVWLATGASRRVRS